MTVEMSSRGPDRTRRPHQAVRRGGYALVSSSLLSSVAGVAYWWVAARSWSDADVGRAAALITTMVLVAEVSSLGMATGLVRSLPRADEVARGLIGRTYATAIALAVPLSAIVIVVVGRWAGDLPQEDVVVALCFVAGAVGWSVFVLQDGALVGLGRATAVPVENGLFGLARILMVTVVAAVGVRTATSLFFTWLAPSIAGVVIVTALLLGRFTSRSSRPVPSGLFGETVRFSLVNHVASMLRRIWPMTMPVIVLSALDAESSSHAFIAWSSAYTLWLIASSTGQALLAEGSRHPVLLHRLTGTALHQTLVLTVLGVVGVVAAAPWYLSLYGAGYAAEGTVMLRLLAIAAIPNAITSIYLSAQRALGQLRSVLAVQAALGLPTLVLSIPVLGLAGLDGLAVLWLANQTAVAVVVLVRGRWTLWVPSLTPRMISMLSRLRHGSVGHPPNRGRILSDRNGVSVVAKCDVGRDTMVAKRSCGDRGTARLQREAHQLHHVHATNELEDLHPLVPEVIALEIERGGGELVLTALPGEHADPTDDVVFTEVARLAGVMRDVTSRPSVIGPSDLDRWVCERVAVLGPVVARATPERLEDLDRLLDRLLADLDAAIVDVGLVHGDLSPSNVLVDPRDRSVTAIIDWELAGTDEPCSLDLVQLVLSWRTALGAGELGQLVAEVLVEGWPEPDERVLGEHDDPRRLPASSQAILLLTWLRHVAANVTKSSDFADNRVWIVRNVLPVLDAVRAER